MMGGESLNTTLADTSQGDTTIGDVSFDEEQIKALAQRANTTVDAASVRQERTWNETSDSKNTSFSHQTGTEAASTFHRSTYPVVPPLKLEALTKDKALLQELSGIKASPGRTLPSFSDRSSDRSYGTKISRLSQETQEWKKMYMNIPDPDLRKKTLSEIMFAGRSRMRENEATLRFGETPRPSDALHSDFFMEKQTPRWNKASPRKAKPAPAKKSQRSLQANPLSRPAKRKESNANLQTYMRKMYRQRKTIDRMAGSEQHRLAHFAGHIQLISQEA